MSDTESESGESGATIIESFIEGLTESEHSELQTTTMEMIDEYITEHAVQFSSPDFHTDLLEDVAHLTYQNLNQSGICDEDDFDAVMEFVEECAELVYNYREIPERSESADISPQPKTPDLHAILEELSNKPQPPQRTKEWFDFRHCHITASNIWKLFSSEAQYNSFIYDKCAKEAASGSYTNNPDSPLAWGHKYEPVTTQIYERMYEANVGVYGIIEHPKYTFLAASPDGIVVNRESPRYGRMVEIKNIVNREITGIPSEAYWIQMQIQMEVCGLSECDFVETRIKEVSDVVEWMASDSMWRGVIVGFVDRNSDNAWSYPSVYRYMPPVAYGSDISIVDCAVTTWIERTRGEMEATHIFYGVNYWILDEISCVLVKRNSLWFEAALPTIKNVWETIVKERETGFEHRLPKKKSVGVKSEGGDHIFQNIPSGTAVCLTKLDA
jgi:putative phage-type endonuclease